MAGQSTQLVMTIIGTDQPGLVESVSRVISEHGGNWLESRMARLAGQFAGILHVEVAADQADAMVEELKTLETGGVGVVIKRSDEPQKGPASRVFLELTGSDHPGIVHHITEVIASKQVNIEELSTGVTGSPMSGHPLFQASAVLQVPPQVSLDELQIALEQVAADLMVDVKLSENSS